MKNKLTIAILMTATMMGFLSVLGYQTGAGTAVQAAAETAKDPAGGSAASQAPAIQDALILEGWNTMRGMREQIQVGNGAVVSGESLAQFLLKSQIPVVWGSDKICGGGSCSLMYCAPDGNCSYEDGKPGIDPIYINSSIQTQSVGMMERLAGELAHEAYHRTRPFGSGKITQIEEYWAFYINTQLSKGDSSKFEDVDPLDPKQLQSWFFYNGLHRYLKLAPYPGSAAQGPQRPQSSTNQSQEAR